MTQQLGKYEVSDVLGKGAMGVVYRGFDPLIRRTVAIKTIRKELIDDEDLGAVERFRNEAQAAGRLSHPGIVAIHDYGEDAELAYIAMEYVDGLSLRDYFVRGVRFEPDEAVGLAVQLLDALHYAHSHGVWHRDIKPANLMITTRGQLKIADFGIARVDGASLTMTGAVIGSPGYMAPEQYQGGDIDWRVDLFAAGVVFYQMLTGEKPFTGNSDQITYMTCFKDPVLPSAAKPEAGLDRYNAPVWKSLAKAPDKRFQSAEAFRDALVRMHGSPAPATLNAAKIAEKPPADDDATKPVPLRDPTGTGRRATAESSTQATPSTSLVPDGWRAEDLKEIESQLAPFAGPLARVLVRRAATTTTDPDALYEKLAADLHTDRERSLFLSGRPRLAARTAPPAPRVSREAPTSRNPPTLSDEVVDTGTRRLAAYLGPIARLVAKKAAAQAADADEFYRLLAEHLGDAGEKRRFLTDA